MQECTHCSSSPLSKRMIWYSLGRRMRRLFIDDDALCITMRSYMYIGSILMEGPPPIFWVGAWVKNPTNFHGGGAGFKHPFLFLPPIKMGRAPLQPLPIHICINNEIERSNGAKGAKLCNSDWQLRSSYGIRILKGISTMFKRRGNFLFKKEIISDHVRQVFFYLKIRMTFAAVPGGGSFFLSAAASLWALFKASNSDTFLAGPQGLWIMF